MEQKEKALQNLKRVKLVVGNGFDLYCGLKTKYEDFFGHFSGKYKYLKEWISKVASSIVNTKGIEEDPGGIYESMERENEINCWDLFFSMRLDSMRGPLWCDIEWEMLESLEGNDNKQKDRFGSHWENVWQFLNKESRDTHCLGTMILGGFIYHKLNGIPDSKDTFYEYLLAQLKLFEEAFGRYIISQHIALNPYIATINTINTSGARRLLTYLCNVAELVAIDCFNFAFTSETRFFEKCKFVNGDCLSPIFGVDSVFDPTSDPRYLFTKTNRRIERDMNTTELPEMLDYENVIVFGHSLNSQDYNYFFPILDQLEMTNLISKKKLVIAYTIYDPKQETEIKKNIRQAFYSLFQKYADYHEFGNRALRLFDSLITQGRVIMYEVPYVSTLTNNFAEKSLDTWVFQSPRDGIITRWQTYLDYGKNLGN